METDLTPDRYLRINEIKNYLYCPRISYYALCLRLDRETDLSRGGIESEQQTKRLMKRRKQALHAVHDGIRQFDVHLVCSRYLLVARLDELIETAAGVYLVDYKDTDKDYGYWKVQMAAYQAAVEEAGMRVLGCYVYTIPAKKYHPVVIQPSDLHKLEAIVFALRDMVTVERCPPPAEQIGKCRSCQFANFCNDIF